MIGLLHLEDAKVVAVKGEEDDGVCEPRGDAHRPRGELVVEQEPPRAAAVRPVEKPLIQSAVERSGFLVKSLMMETVICNSFLSKGTFVITGPDRAMTLQFCMLHKGPKALFIYDIHRDSSVDAKFSVINLGILPHLNLGPLSMSTEVS